jgi:hypothetical protein
MACGVVKRSGSLCGDATHREVTTSSGYRLEFCELHWGFYLGGAPVQVQAQCRNNCGMDASPDYADRHWKDGVCGFCRAIEARPELADVLRVSR